MPVPLIAALALIATQTQQAIPPTNYKPEETKVLIVPPMNLSGDKFKDMVQNQINEARKTLRRGFESRGFTVIADTEADQIVKDSGVDFNDEENYKKDVLYKLGEAAKTRLVIFTIIESTGQKTLQNFLADTIEGRATMKTWFLDVDEKKPILSAAKYDGKSTRAGTGSQRQVRAVRLALDEQFKPFYKGYPVVKKIDE